MNFVSISDKEPSFKIKDVDVVAKMPKSAHLTLLSLHNVLLKVVMQKQQTLVKQRTNLRFSETSDTSERENTSVMTLN